MASVNLWKHLPPDKELEMHDKTMHYKVINAWVTTLKTCISSGDIEKGRAVHARAIETGYDSNIYVGNILIDLYGKCRSMLDARRVFNRIPEHSVVSWNALIHGYVKNGHEEMAFEVVHEMQREGACCDGRTLVALFNACSGLAEKEEGRALPGGSLIKMVSLQKGMAVHSFASKSFHLDAFVKSALIDMYCKCGSMADAQRVFDDMPNHGVVAWSSIVLGYATNCGEVLALELMMHMQVEGIVPDTHTFVAALKACASLATRETSENRVKAASLEKGMSLHATARALGCDKNLFVENTLIDMYAKCGSISDAQRVFGGMSHRNMVSWTALLSGYSENGEKHLALELLLHMKGECLWLDPGSFATGLKVCSEIADIEIGQAIHSDICRCGFESDAISSSALVDLYGKCGSSVHAQHVFDTLEVRGLFSWTALMTGYSQECDTSRVFHVFQSMQDEAVTPNSITFMCVLSACSHAGVLEKGKECFALMSTRYGVAPDIEHYHCMIDILGRANEVDRALEMVESMPCVASVVTWRSLLGACSFWKNVEVGRLAFDRLLRLDKRDSSAYMLMANIYKSKCMWEEGSRIERMLESVKVSLHEL